MQRVFSTEINEFTDNSCDALLRLFVPVLDHLLCFVCSQHVDVEQVHDVQGEIHGKLSFDKLRRMLADEIESDFLCARSGDWAGKCNVYLC